MLKVAIALVPLVAWSSGLAAQEVRTEPGGPLFQSHEVLSLTIEGPLKSVFKERGQESSYHPGLLILVDAAGDTARLEIEIKTRGKNRLQRSVCSFPPLRVRFPSQSSARTPFAGQKTLKLVTHCRDRDEYEQYVIKEYLAYRTFNVLTELSFRVRLAHITYVDTDDGRRSETRYAFFIEHEERMAERNGWKALQIPAVAPHEVDRRQTALVDVFQYLIGHTDYSAFMAESDEDECCHNVKLIGTPVGPVFPVPYDFDGTGLVDARYAVPDERFGSRSVRERFFRGFCMFRDDVVAVLPLFRERREAIYALVEREATLAEKVRERAIDYYDEFYDVLSNEKRVERELVKECRPLP